MKKDCSGLCLRAMANVKWSGSFGMSYPENSGLHINDSSSA